jgi:MFS family permease
VEDCREWVYDRSVFTETLATEFDLVCAHKTRVSFLGTIYMVGLFLGSLAGGFVNDRLGRKKALHSTLSMQTKNLNLSTREESKQSEQR